MLSIGDRVRHTKHGEEGFVEDFNSYGVPCIRWDYGNRLATPECSLTVLTKCETLQESKE